MEIMGRLGLRPWEDWALEQMRLNLEDARVAALGKRRAITCVFRNTGRTTRHVVAALAAMSDGQRIVCASEFLRRNLLLTGNSIGMPLPTAGVCVYKDPCATMLLEYPLVDHDENTPAPISW
jgi:hypothetical protein